MKFLVSLLLPLLLAPPTSFLRAASPAPVKGKNGMVVSAEKLASAVGVEILKKGGNAVDAAVATGFALAVTFPGAGNIGGGGFMVIRMADGRATSFDYREKAPAKAHRDMYLDSKGNYLPEKSQEGYLSIGVPGSVAGLLDALQKYGTMKREQVLEPAIKLAEEGFVVSPSFERELIGQVNEFNKYPSSKKVFTKNGKPFQEGDTLIQKDLAETLKRISREGKDGFYRGKTAELLVEEMKRGGGLITIDDLKNYQAIERPVVRGTYRGFEVLSMGPPSSGGIALIHMLHLLERYNIALSGFGSSRTISLMAEAMKLTYADRAEFLGDADFYPVPTERLLSRKYADERAKLIDTLKATPSVQISHGEMPKREGTNTTHYSVADKKGSAVSVTTTINSWFGSSILVDGAGFFLNNEMDDFAAKPGVPNQFGLLGGDANSVQPNKRMLSAMTPTIVLKDNNPFLIVGSPGGSTIITTVLQMVLNVIDHGMNIQQAVDAMRIHHQWRPDTLYYEHKSLAADVTDNLKRRGYFVLERSGYQGRVEGIMIDRERGVFTGATDPRGNGAAIGY
jgi:gamma-glutamyltranspeptidase/glutathione hydrolase